MTNRLVNFEYVHFFETIKYTVIDMRAERYFVLNKVIGHGHRSVASLRNCDRSEIIQFCSVINLSSGELSYHILSVNFPP